MAAIGASTSTAPVKAGRSARHQTAHIVTSSISSRRFRPFTAQRPSGRQQLEQQRWTLRAAEPETPEAAAPSPQVAEDDDFSFSFSGAKKNNEYSPSDVEAALKFYSDGEGQGTEYERDHVSNVTGEEDASYFDDIDNVEGYEGDEYATAGIAEAAPKQKRRGGPGNTDGGGDDGDDIDKAKEIGASQQLEEAAILRAQLEEMESSEADLDIDESMQAADTGVWSWLADYENASEVPSEDLSTVSLVKMAAVPSEGEVLSNLAKGIAGGEELDMGTREYLDFLADDVALEQELALLDGKDEEVPEPAPDAEDDSSRVQALLEEDIEPVDIDLSPLEDDDNLPSFNQNEAIDEGAFEAYLSELRSVASPAADSEQEGSNAVDELVQAKLAELAGDQQAEPIEDDGLDSEEADIEQLLQRVPAPHSGVGAELLDTFTGRLADDEVSAEQLQEEDEQAAAFRKELNAMMADESGWTDETYPTQEEVAVYESFVNVGEDYLVGEEQRRQELSEAVARGELPMDVLEEEMADPTDPELEIYNSVLEAVEDEEGANYAVDDDENDGITWQERIIELTRVTKVTKGGKVMGFRCTAVVGNQAGLVGVGCDSGREVAIAVKRALVDAKKNVVAVPLVGAGTIPHRVESKFKAARCVVRPASDGTGVIAGGSIRSVLELAGVQNCLAKRLGCRTPLTNARATIAALQQLRTLGEVSSSRGVPYQELLVPSKK